MDKHVALIGGEFQSKLFQKFFQSWDLKQFLCYTTV